MALISLRNLGVTLSVPLFSNLNFVLEAGDRVGVVAANGRGKSTLLRCIAGTVEPTVGDVTRSRGARIGLVEQDVPASLTEVPLREAVLRALPQEQIDGEAWRADVVLHTLDVPEDLRGRPLSQLSGGWQRLAMLACTWVTEPDILLLDEPTNHLDLARIGQLEKWVAALPRDLPVMISSHDRAFLDATTNRTLFLRPGQSQVFSLPYSRARGALAQIDAAQQRQFDRDMKVAEQMRRQAAKLNNIGINSGSDLLTVKTKQLRQRAERLEDAARSAHQERSSGDIKLANRGTHAKILVTLEDAAVETPDGTLLFRTGKRWICQGDRIVLLGANGTGKSRLIESIRKVVEATVEETGPIRATPSLALGHIDQGLSGLVEDQSPMATILHRFELGDQRARSLLARAGLTIEMQERPTGKLSGGQKARLAMLILRLTNPNFYLLDEPTNHLDIQGQEALEAELTARDASCLLISHDRSFVRAVGNRFWQIDRRRLVEVEDPEDFFSAMAKSRD